MLQATAIKVMQTGLSAFLTGEPGSGKTHTINTYVKWLRERGIEPSITASTGIAATHVGGMTIHSWCGIGIRETLTAWDLDAITSKEKVVSRVKSAQVLIIDEISMLAADTLDMVEVVCREIRKNDLPFGGLQVILVGDFFQLPPIVKRATLRHSQSDIEYEDQSEQGEPPFAFRARAWARLNPIVCYLHEQHRQEDAVFLSVLSAIRRGAVTQEVRDTLSARSKTSVTEDVPHLYSHNADVDTMNTKKLSSIDEKAHVFNMLSRGPAHLVESLKRGCLSPETLILKEGARVMFTKNDPAGNYVNGTLGIIDGFQDDGNPVVKTHDNRHVFVDPVEWHVTDGDKILARITQLPLRLAWAITVHKSQGLTLDAAVMDLSHAFEYGQGYVALSRVRTLERLHLRGINERALEVHREVRSQDREFKLKSAAARTSFEAMGEAEHEALVQSFVTASGGHMSSTTAKQKVTSQKKQSLSEKTLEKTLTLLKSGLTVQETAKARGFVTSTIHAHIRDLFEQGKLSESDIARHLSSTIQGHLREVVALFEELGTDRLTPVYERLEGRYTYDDLHIARLLMKKARD